jgi:AbrB family looped-hinge helix DNA binding protein
MITARVSSKCQVTLPKRVRQALQVEPGERVLFVVADKTVELRSLGASTAQTLAGSLGRYRGTRETSEEIRKVTKKGVARAAAQEG